MLGCGRCWCSTASLTVSLNVSATPTRSHGQVSELPLPLPSVTLRAILSGSESLHVGRNTLQMLTAVQCPGPSISALSCGSHGCKHACTSKTQVKPPCTPLPLWLLPRLCSLCSQTASCISALTTPSTCAPFQPVASNLCPSCPHSDPQRVPQSSPSSCALCFLRLSATVSVCSPHYARSLPSPCPCSYVLHTRCPRRTQPSLFLHAGVQIQRSSHLLEVLGQLSDASPHAVCSATVPCLPPPQLGSKHPALPPRALGWG